MVQLRLPHSGGWQLGFALFFIRGCLRSLLQEMRIITRACQKHPLKVCGLFQFDVKCHLGIDGMLGPS